MNIDKDPVIVRKIESNIVGIERYTENGIASIREAWAEFMTRLGEVPHQTTPPIPHGFEDYSRGLVLKPGEFPKYYYLAGVQVERLTDIPEGMTAKVIPEADYAVFTHRGPIDNLHDSFRYIYETWMPNSGYKMDPEVSGDFERYPAPLTDMQNALVEIHVPVVKK
jgi:AraC family transcriptional regulator